MGAVAVAVVVIAFVALCVLLFRPHLRRMLAAGSEPEPRGFGEDGPDAAGVREPRTPKPSAGSAVAAAEPPGDTEAA
jgi:hypothetical protein